MKVNQIVKQALFLLMHETLQWNVCDNMEDLRQSKQFPQVCLRSSGATKDILRDSFKQTLRFKIHIFSKYDGEKEILEMENALMNCITNLYDIDGVIYIQESGFHITVDKSTGVEMKHGIITLNIRCAVQFKEEVQEDEEHTG